MRIRPYVKVGINTFAGYTDEDPVEVDDEDEADCVAEESFETWMFEEAEARSVDPADFKDAHPDWRGAWEMADNQEE